MSIDVQRVSRTFPGGVTALREVSLAVQTGELVALLGPSGSGKTTLLRIIGGLEPPDPGSGAIRFHDEDVGQRHVRHRGVGFVFQHYALFRHMSVFENVAFGLRVRPRNMRLPEPEIAARVMTLLEMVQLGAMASRRPHELSGGQRQRVALARALAVEPNVLLLDEPFGALDAKVRKELRQWLRRLHDELHVTSVFVTHDQEEALEVADRVAVMNAGRIEQFGTPDEVFHHPANEFVMRFMGHVNLFHCRVENEGLSFQGPGKTAGMPTFVRPHEMDLAREPNGSISLRAMVRRLHAAGAIVRVELHGEDDQDFHAEITHDCLRSLGLAEGMNVYVNPKAFRVFTDDTGPELTEGGVGMVTKKEPIDIPEHSCEKILLALSTFRRSEEAVKAALRYLKPGGRLSILWVVDVNLARYFVGTDAGLYGNLKQRCERDLLRQHEEEGRKAADTIAAQARTEGFAVDVDVTVGRFGLVAEEKARRFSPQLIVTTRSNRPGWVKRLFGSPVNYLIDHSDCPVIDA